ncbi:MAG TPA: radical SAM family heme chaperone HemW [Jatrophihabitantaceae bacterium]|nr:radical SAM family heme chaperone HemW [Jatrophihabitantaceae bacterium]
MSHDLTSFGYYIHVPFCARRCDYCAFATWTDRPHLIDEYLRACRTDIDRRVAQGAPPATSVFFGGGTPSLVPSSALMDVLAAIPHERDAEVTVECNPDTVTPELFDTYARGGVNRVSLGVQSMQPHVLQSLGRTHDVANVRAAAALASASFPTFNLDVIYGGAGETLDDWRRTLESVLELAPPHVSAYALTIEAGTPLADDADRHPDDDDQADKYLLATEVLRDAGLEWYEISNWARPGHECRHNWLYWSQGEYLGVGCAAHSHRNGRRWWNVRTPERYIDAVASNHSVEAGDERLEPDARELEALQLSLRTRAGVPADALPDDPELRHLVVVDNGSATLTIEGRLLANEVALRLRHPSSIAGSSKT